MCAKVHVQIFVRQNQYIIQNQINKAIEWDAAMDQTMRTNSNRTVSQKNKNGIENGVRLPNTQTYHQKLRPETLDIKIEEIVKKGYDLS